MGCNVNTHRLHSFGKKDTPRHLIILEPFDDGCFERSIHVTAYKGGIEICIGGEGVYVPVAARREFAKAIKQAFAESDAMGGGA